MFVAFDEVLQPFEMSVELLPDFCSAVVLDGVDNGLELFNLQLVLAKPNLLGVDLASELLDNLRNSRDLARFNSLLFDATGAQQRLVGPEVRIDQIAVRRALKPWLDLDVQWRIVLVQVEFSARLLLQKAVVLRHLRFDLFERAELVLALAERAGDGAIGVDRSEAGVAVGMAAGEDSRHAGLVVPVDHANGALHINE